MDDDDWIEVLDDKWTVGRLIERKMKSHMKEAVR